MASVWAIGDIHGHYDLLEQMLDQLPRGEDDTTVFLGDFVDRGPKSATIISRLLAEYDKAPDKTVLLWGNHEDLAAEHWGIPSPSSFNYEPEDWFRNGGTETMLSYGYKYAEIFEAPCPEDFHRLFSLLKTFWRAPVERYPELAHVIWVHAGLLPGEQPENSSGDTLLWVRDDFLNVTDPSGRLVIHGHTPVKKIAPQIDKIGIDTGAAYGGPLTALELPSRRVFQATGKGKLIQSVLP